MALVEKPLVRRFKPLLKKEKNIILSKFMVRIKMDQYRATKHMYNISFKENTEVSDTKDDRIPLYRLNLIPFHELPTTSEDEMFLVGMLIILFGLSISFTFSQILVC